MEKKTSMSEPKTAIPKELLDQLLALGGGSEGLGGPEGLLSSGSVRKVVYSRSRVPF